MDADTTAGAATAAAQDTGAAVRLTNWLGDVVTHPAAVVEPTTVEEISTVLRDTERYPSPVRAHGSAHSTTFCLEADGGTVVSMRRLDRIVGIGEDTVTAEAGALYIDVGEELRGRGLEFFVNTEFGCLTIGSAACAGTKDGSLPDEYGQISSYCVGMKIVTPAGETLEITEGDRDLLEAARSSYGLLGIVVEATFRVRPIQLLAVRHRAFSLAQLERELSGLLGARLGMMAFFFPSLDLVTVELSRVVGDAASGPAPRDRVWRLRNFVWQTVVPRFAYLIGKYGGNARRRAFLSDRLHAVVQRVLRLVIHSKHTTAYAQMIRYPEKAAHNGRFTFTFWAFPEDRYLGVLRDYFDWVAEYERRTGYRPNVGNVMYRVAEDRSALLSYSWDGPVLTIDPVSTGDDGWFEFLEAFNEFSSERGGRPLPNQTWGLKPEHLRKAYGERLERFEQVRRRYDPGNRLLSRYFRELLESES